MFAINQPGSGSNRWEKQNQMMKKGLNLKRIFLFDVFMEKLVIPKITFTYYANLHCEGWQSIVRIENNFEAKMHIRFSICSYLFGFKWEQSESVYKIICEYLIQKPLF